MSEPQGKPRYRCPYCRERIDGPHGKCPHCGKALRPPENSDGAAGRRDRRRKIDLIRRDAERRKAALGGMRQFRRGPVFYFAIIMGLAILGLSLMNVMRGGAGGPSGEERKIVKARKGADTIAEALGRFKFHAGEYPQTADETEMGVLDGLAALVMKEPPRYPKAVGPYLKAHGYIPGAFGKPARPAPIMDPWGRPYEYALSNGVPSVVSPGPDGKRGTADDIAADPEAYLKPFRDTSWTNDWVRYTERGIILKPTPENERVVEDNGEDLMPWLASGICVAAALLVLIVAAIAVQSRRGARKKDPDAKAG